MPMVFNNTNGNEQTHIFLVGVGAYRFLQDGAEAKPQESEVALKLGQLSSPVVTIEALYNKFLEFENAGCWSKPLGSIHVLASPIPGSNAFAGLNIQPATFANIQTDYRAWRDLCDQHKGNVAIFYYCGHGLEKAYQYLLTEEFGRFPDDPWQSGAFNFDLTRTAFNGCKAETQLFFVDACRQVTSDMLAANLTIPSLQTSDQLTAESRFNLTIKAAATNEKAYGKKNEVSYFSQALMNGLSGQVAMKQNNEWIIETSCLVQNIYRLLNMVNPEQAYKQRCQCNIGESAMFLKHQQAPEVKLEIYCAPEAALPVAELSCRNSHNNQEHKRNPSPGKWSLEVDAGVYEISAKFNTSNFKNHSDFYAVYPPFFEQKLICE